MTRAKSASTICRARSPDAGKRLAQFGRRLDATHALTPGKSPLVTEFGHEAALRLPGEEYGSEEEQAEVLEGKRREISRRSACIVAGFTWCLADVRTCQWRRTSVGSTASTSVTA